MLTGLHCISIEGLKMSKDKNNKYSIVVGIPSYNEADNISYVAETASEGLVEYFPDHKSILVNVDNNSPDNTKEAFLGAKTKVEKKYISTADGVVGKGNNFLNLFNFAKEVEADAIIVVDADLKSISKDWIERLGRPIIDGYDYVTPFYSRHQFDATITNHICYPAIYGMLSIDIRQPIGGDFAFSSSLMDHWLKQRWSEAVKQYGIDIFMSLNALLGGFKVCQTRLGNKDHKPSSPKVGLIFEQVAETLFSTLLEHKDSWFDGDGRMIITPDSFGPKTLPEPPEVALDIHDMKEACKREYRQYETKIRKMIDPYAISKICEMFELDRYDMDTLLWAQIFYSLIYKYDKSKSEVDKKEIINILKPLYLARALSFNYNTWKHNIKYAEMEVRNQALGFASQKHYLRGLYIT